MNSMNCRPLLAVLLLATMMMSTACVYRANISQGNIVVEEDLDQVELDMTRNQVRFLLGTPMIDDPFNRERWDYVYYLKLGAMTPSSSDGFRFSSRMIWSVKSAKTRSWRLTSRLQP